MLEKIQNYFSEIFPEKNEDVKKDTEDKPIDFSAVSEEVSNFDFNEFCDDLESKMKDIDDSIEGFMNSEATELNEYAKKIDLQGKIDSGEEKVGQFKDKLISWFQKIKNLFTGKKDE